MGHIKIIFLFKQLFHFSTGHSRIRNPHIITLILIFFFYILIMGSWGGGGMLKKMQRKTNEEKRNAFERFLILSKYEKFSQKNWKLYNHGCSFSSVVLYLFLKNLLQHPPSLRILGPRRSSLLLSLDNYESLIPSCDLEQVN